MAEVDAWLTTPLEPEPHLQPELFAKVTLALMLDAQLTATWTRSGSRTSTGCAS